MTTTTRGWVDYGLWLLLAIGLLGALKVSYENFTGSLCPHVLFVPVCYLVLLGYALMALSVVVRHSGGRHYFFLTGWSLAAAIALIGSAAELLAGGGVCPATGAGSLRGGAVSTGIPLCYVSLGLLIVMLVLFALGPYRRACARYNHQRAGTGTS